MATSHISGDDLELYAMERLPESDTAPVEEHLLVCEECRVRLAEWDGYVRAMRSVIAASLH
jgi:anti-sigma factor RsiW